MKQAHANISATNHARLCGRENASLPSRYAYMILVRMYVRSMMHPSMVRWKLYDMFPNV